MTRTGAMTPEGGPGIDEKMRQEIALHRWAVIAEAANTRLASSERGAVVRAIAAREHAHPDGTVRRYSRGTVDRWLRAWRAGGAAALRPSLRSDTGKVRAMPELFGEAAALRLELPGRAADSGRIARSRRGGRGRTGDLGPCRPGPTPVEPPRGSANVKVAQGKGTRRDTEGEPEPGQRPKGTNRRTPDEGKPGEGGRRGKNPAGKRETGGKPAGGTGGREVRPQTTR
jgi:hypothetical protein